MKLSRLTNRQLRNLLRWGEVRFSDSYEERRKREKQIARRFAISFYKKINSFLSDFIELLESGKIRFQNLKQWEELGIRFYNLLYKFSLGGAAIYVFSGSDEKRAANIIKREIKTAERAIEHWEKGDDLGLDVFAERLMEKYKNFSLPNARNYFRKFIK